MKKLLILDTSAMMYRAYFALLNLRNSKGKNIGAILGFINQLEAAIKYFNPDYIIAAKDVRRKELKRTEIYSEYKGNRESAPDDLIEQMQDIDEILDGYNIPIIKISGYEADDSIGSAATRFSKDMEVIILTGDKDLTQLVDENISVALMGKKGDEEPYRLIKTSNDVKEFIGVYPEQIVDLFALMGDSSDSIPGVKGIGSKTGIKLIVEYGDIDNLYQNIDDIKGKLKDKLIVDKEMAYISKKLASIFKNLEVDIELKEKFDMKNRKFKQLADIYQKLDLKKEYEKIREEISETNTIEYDVEQLLTLNDFINKFNDSKTQVSIYSGEEGYSFFDGEKLYYTFEKEDSEDLFKLSADISLINTNKDVIIYSNKEWMNKNIYFNNYFDVLLAIFTLSMDAEQELEKVLFDRLNISVPNFDKKIVSKMNEEELNSYYLERMDKLTYGLYVLKNELYDNLKIENSKERYNEEKEFTKVLKYMEDNGISIDLDYFKEYNKELGLKIEQLVEEIYIESGEEFKISSPKQLGYILFEKLGIKGEKKNKSGAYSTDAEVLELLSLRGINIAKLILEYREYEKLRSTYVEPLMQLAVNNKIHTTYNQTGTATGRLSSQNPNLQNIPTRTEEGTKIRKGFRASKGKKLISFDYSQIELRVLAEISGDPHLIEAYTNDLDLHELTARKIFAINKDEEVTKYQRNIAKVINFSVLYGKTPYGLSKELKIPVSDAKDYIDTYFREYPKVRILLDEIIEKCRENEYVETIFGAKRYVHSINSGNLNIREQANRMAVNTVIQGSAAGIIKKVMKRIYNELCNDKLKMLLQVHDELIFEVDENYIDIVDKIIDIMENTIKFEKIKLKVNYNIGENWGDLK